MSEMSALPQVQNRRKILVSGDIRADFKRAEIFKDGQLLKLTPLEAQLLEIFLRNPEIIIKKRTVLRKAVGRTRQFCGGQHADGFGKPG